MMNASGYVNRLGEVKYEARKQFPKDEDAQRRFIENRMGYIGKESLAEKSQQADDDMRYIRSRLDHVDVSVCESLFWKVGIFLRILFP